jgi:nucleoid DNA-binding protein
MANIKQKAIVNIPDKYTKSIRSALIRHGKVKVNNLGIFETRKIESRLGRNPTTGEIVKIRSYVKVKFRGTASLMKQVDKGRDKKI